MAVKIVAHNCALSSLAEVLRESALSTSITHPNVVRAVYTVCVICNTSSAVTSSAATTHAVRTLSAVLEGA